MPMLPLAFAGRVASAQTPGPPAVAPTAGDTAAAHSSPDTAVTVSFGGFVDNYYAYDFGRPVNFDRPFTTQAVRHNEFNVNLVWLEAKVSGPRVRGRLALQAGTSVQSNYAGEPLLEQSADRASPGSSRKQLRDIRSAQPCGWTEESSSLTSVWKTGPLAITLPTLAL
jgi:Putative beta-barrel porin-2, OmpL-like. bbp2